MYIYIHIYTCTVRMPKLPTHPRTPQGLPVSAPGGPQDTHKHHKYLRGPIQELPGTARNSRFQPLGASAPQGGPQSAPKWSPGASGWSLRTIGVRPEAA